MRSTINHTVPKTLPMQENMFLHRLYKEMLVKRGTVRTGIYQKNSPLQVEKRKAAVYIILNGADCRVPGKWRETVLYRS